MLIINKAFGQTGSLPNEVLDTFHVFIINVVTLTKDFICETKTQMVQAIANFGKAINKTLNSKHAKFFID